MKTPITNNFLHSVHMDRTKDHLDDLADELNATPGYILEIQNAKSLHQIAVALQKIAANLTET